MHVYMRMYYGTECRKHQRAPSPPLPLSQDRILFKSNNGGKLHGVGYSSYSFYILLVSPYCTQTTGVSAHIHAEEVLV